MNWYYWLIIICSCSGIVFYFLWRYEKLKNTLLKEQNAAIDAANKRTETEIKEKIKNENDVKLIQEKINNTKPSNKPKTKWIFILGLSCLLNYSCATHTVFETKYIKSQYPTLQIYDRPALNDDNVIYIENLQAIIEAYETEIKTYNEFAIKHNLNSLYGEKSP